MIGLSRFAGKSVFFDARISWSPTFVQSAASVTLGGELSFAAGPIEVRVADQAGFRRSCSNGRFRRFATAANTILAANRARAAVHTLHGALRKQSFSCQQGSSLLGPGGFAERRISREFATWNSLEHRNAAPTPNCNKCDWQCAGRSSAEARNSINSGFCHRPRCGFFVSELREFITFVD